MGRISYSEKLKDWRCEEKRKRILERDSFTCMSCGVQDRTLEVNHLWYRGEPWEVPDAALETLCSACHRWRTCANTTLREMSTKELRVYMSGSRFTQRKRLADMMDYIGELPS